MKRLVFLHIPKTAGISIRKALRRQYHRKHFRVLKHRGSARKTFSFRIKKLDQKNINLHCFAVMRDPLDRALSAYWYLMRGGLVFNNGDARDRDIHLAPYADFNEFVEQGGLETASKHQVHFRPQNIWMRDNDPYNIHIVHYENINKELNDFLSNLKFAKLHLSHRNVSDKGAVEISDESRKIISRIYKKDYELWRA